MIKIKPNSIESVILFILYICMQDGKFSKQESEELIATAPLIQKMYFDFFGEYIPEDLNLLIASVHKNLNNYLIDHIYYNRDHSSFLNQSKGVISINSLL